ncbi:ABC transporter ATP-binding protein [Pseudolabrys taiwanensis]|uniref:ABC transporter ATP-binding protein n=1 Tax=Pseudolabrys taiwanensis TaxID=331696 RepID=UPI001FDEE0A5|nr:ATP-binding cassette domain-containing protein [Pseudolabrys taiwanensis]
MSDISLDIGTGEHIAVLGRSGAGKSTLLHLLAGLLQPSRGSIAIDGGALNNEIGHPVLMFQRPALLPWLSARDNVLLPLHFANAVRLDRAAATAKADGLIAQVGLGERADALPTHLSGGQQQRVALARALASDPAVLLLDEPFSALDQDTRAVLRSDIRALARARGMTLVTVTHDLSDAAALADRIFVLAGAPGRIEREVVLGDNPEDELRAYFAGRRDAA